MGYQIFHRDLGHFQRRSSEGLFYFSPTSDCDELGILMFLTEREAEEMIILLEKRLNMLGFETQSYDYELNDKIKIDANKIAEALRINNTWGEA